MADISLMMLLPGEVHRSAQESIVIEQHHEKSSQGELFSLHYENEVVNCQYADTLMSKKPVHQCAK